ncbi:(Fe-S)-binding protein [Marihabitans asiaticum]|uniref:Fe-S oxidoreductase n=1 Tax=Marihabitans asiaticum TaxID=415218 RepID=A0A560WEA0_9MICO|nr:Fe-S oxidoreductase [Marihabitans asiaticum]
MSALQVLALVIGLAFTVVGWAMLARAVRHLVATFRLGQPEPGRTDQKGQRTATLLREFLGHTRMARLPVVAIAHWVTMVSFGVLFLTLVQATFQLADPHFTLPLIGHFWPYEWITELFAVAGLIGIVALIVIRQRNHPRSAAGEDGRRSRFFGSTFWQAYYVELTILGVAVCITLLRGLERAMLLQEGSGNASLLHFPLTGWLGSLFSGLSMGALEALIVAVALIKIIISYAWMITISVNPTMGVAWHRFLAFFNIFFKRHADGRTSLGALQPMTVGGKPFSMEVMEELAEDEEGEEVSLGVGKVEDFTWKGLLDFSTCTECGRCQSQCPAWNTDKPLSPKMLMMTLRDHSQAKAPYLAAAQEAKGVISTGFASPQTAAGAIPSEQYVTAGGAAPEGEGGSVATSARKEPAAVDWSSMALVGQTGYDVDNPLTAYDPLGPDAVIDEDVLWSCTTCGACVEQCPVDIEHVDHIVDMRRYQNLIASAFPSELGGLFKKLESKGNPWGMGAKARMDWAKDLPFTVKVLGEDVESADQVDYLFWVGCAGAYEDRAKKTTRAVAELFDIAGVDFAVLGNGETCTGDSARRAGNEVLFQMLAEQNVETLNEVGATKIVVTCAHCFNTIKNEYPQLGGTYEVLHHTQLLNRLVREKKLAPVRRPDTPEKSSLKNVASTAGTVTYHDPCYLGRHNNVYAPPRELIGALPGVELREMERTKEKSFCCGAGGARMWMEEQLGTRINLNRTDEAIATGAERIAVGCPFCRVMLSDGLTAKQSEGASEDIEVVDVAQMLLSSVKEAPEAPSAGATESQEQAEAEPKTAVADPTEGQDAKGAQPAPETPAEKEAAAEAVDEAGEDGDVVREDQTEESAAAKNAAPSWETGAASAAAESSAAEKNAAPSWETGTTPAATESTAAEKNAAPSWETGTTPAAAESTAAEKNAAPSWEAGPSAAAPASGEETKPDEPAEDTPSTPPAGAKTAESDVPATGNEDLSAKNAAPSWETGPSAAAPASGAATKPADTEAERPASDSSSTPPAGAKTAESDVPATGNEDLATKNAAPSWETGAPAAAPEAESPAAGDSTEDHVGGQDQVTGSEDVDQPQDEVTPDEPAEDTPSTPPAGAKTAEPDVPATGNEDLAAKNAAPSWETGPSAPAPASGAETKPTDTGPDTEAESPAAADSTEDHVGGQDQVTGSEDVDQPQDEVTPDEPAEDTPSTPPTGAKTAESDVPATGNEDLAAKNAAPSWETGPSAPAPASGAETKPTDTGPDTEAESPAAGDSTEDHVGGQDQVTGSEDVDQPQDEVTPDEPAEDTPSPATGSGSAGQGVDLDDLAQKNAKPSWE